MYAQRWCIREQFDRGIAGACGHIPVVVAAEAARARLPGKTNLHSIFQVYPNTRSRYRNNAIAPGRVEINNDVVVGIPHHTFLVPARYPQMAQFKGVAAKLGGNHVGR